MQIIDTYYKAPYNTIIESVPQRHAAVYRITVEYNGKEYDITGMDAYNKCSEKSERLLRQQLKNNKWNL